MTHISIKFYAEYFALRLAAAFVRRLPRNGVIAFGRAMGRLAMRILPSRYQMAKRNMTLALPDLSVAEIESNVRKNFEHIGISGVEMLRLDMSNSAHDGIRQYLDIDGLEHLQEAMALQKGAILLTAHLGFWELGALIPTELGVPCDIVAKPMKNPLSDAYFAKVRKAFGAELLSSRHGARKILKSIQAKRAVGVLLDQHISPPGSIATEFFGRKAYTTTAITSLAMKYQIPVVPIFCLRKPDNRYDIWVEPMLLLATDGEHTVETNTQLLVDRIESAIRRDVTQWFWMHKRWRVKPDIKGQKKSE